ncbi:M48 family metallopeptidase [Dysgonomonas sp. HGC4]|uniref:M48 family metallopeptidase n=1 Tax=Dysgonomonas sp. HGC4 TaxID=1658009 RepID=UPI0006814532|nr:M48 family metallopeptidase [Dysgonomonas sp. HGC4]MBD8348347.1 M48 family metallopeptidase [Dysgonomonas sp. HGC4]
MIYYTILLFVILDFLWTQYLAYRNRKRMNPNIPEQLIGIYDQEKYQKQQAYQKENSRIGLFSGFVSFVIILLILVFNGFGYLDQYVRGYIHNSILVSLAFIGILYIGNEIISLPFSLYDTFVIEKKYGFNKSTLQIFWIDQLKGLILSVILGGLILTLLIWFYNGFGNYAWLYAWGLITAFSLFMTLFYSNIIVPLFNKQTPLEPGELRNAIEKFSQKAGFELTNIYVMDASKRSTKANAYFTGLGSKKRIVLFDTLINDLTTDEIVAVLAHEIGHYKKKHIIQHLITSIYIGVLLFILSFFLNNSTLALALGSEIPSFHLGIIAFSILFTPISLLLGLLMNMASRKNEYEADAYAASFGLGDSLISGLKKLSVEALSNLNPDPWNVFVYYSHPTLLQRIERLRLNNQE